MERERGAGPAEPSLSEASQKGELCSSQELRKGPKVQSCLYIGVGNSYKWHWECTTSGLGAVYVVQEHSSEGTALLHGFISDFILN